MTAGPSAHHHRSGNILSLLKELLAQVFQFAETI
jgi:hypothetical protein